MAKANKMSAEQRRAWHESAIAAGGSVLHDRRVITSLSALPTLGDLAETEQEMAEALSDIDRRRQALNDEEARVRARETSSAVSEELPEDFPGRAALNDAGHKTKADVAKLSEEELTEIPGIGPATAKKIVEARG